MNTRPLSLRSKCYVCGSPSDVDSSQIGIYDVVCCRCGTYKISSQAVKGFPWGDLSTIQKANFSGFISENNGLLIKLDNLAYLQSLRTPSVFEKADKLLRKLSQKFPTAGDVVTEKFHLLPQIMKFVEEHDRDGFTGGSELEQACCELLPWVAASWVQKSDEFTYIYRTYLHNSTGFLDGVGSGLSSRITPNGWSRLQEISTPAINSKNAFVAMWFDASVHPAWLDAIKPAIEDAGYEAIRIDKKEHNNKIDDEIVAGIRGCKFLVADFTGQRGGVYFEAGFAQGLGKQVIWLCREDELDQVHFDTRQYSHIPWKPDDLPALRVALKNRVEATIGKTTPAGP
jgi:hypothetical protein